MVTVHCFALPGQDEVRSTETVDCHHFSWAGELSSGASEETTMLKKILLVLLVVVVGFLAYVATRPDEFRVERSATIAAPASAVYPQIADFRAWEAWSPWEKLDPAMKREFGGAAGEPGSTYSWVGNSDVGSGKMTLVEAAPSSKVGIRLEFIEPFASTSTTTFALAPEGDGTRVTWTMDGRHNFVSKAMCVFMDMDKMVGGDFEKGLASLKSVGEAAAAAAPAEPATETAPPAEGVAPAEASAPAETPAAATVASGA
jgi:hypothetical protein